MKMNSNQQKGFTLIEISIVLVIIGLLLGGVLQGQQLIENSRIKSAANDLDGLSTAIMGYRDKYRKFPGDDGPVAAVRARGTNWATVRGGNSNGVVQVPLANAFNGANENFALFQQLRADGLLAGDPGIDGAITLPTNAWGGRMGITSANMGGGLTGHKICMSEVPGSAARSMDLQVDDGDGASGQFRATLGASGVHTPPTNVALVAAYNDDNVYTICKRI